MAIVLIWIMFLIPNVWTTFYYNPFTYPKWIFVDLFFALCAIGMVHKKKLVWPKSEILTCFFLMMMFRLIASLLNHGTVPADNFITAMQFTIAVWYFMNSQDKVDFRKIFWPVMVLGSLIVIQSFTITAPIGNINIHAEFLILFLPLIILLYRQTVGWKRYWAVALLTFWILSLIIGQSRSAWIGLAIVAIYEFRRYKKSLAAGLFVFAIGFMAFNIYVKAGSTGHRFDLYKSSMDMMLHHPLGIGGGNFEFGYIPYQLDDKEYPREIEIYASPHNEFLKWGIEQGWIYLGAVLSFWLLLGRFLFRFHHADQWFITFLRCSFLVIIPQLLFQFPFENPASLAGLAFLLGSMLAFQSQYRSEPQDSKSLKIIFIIMVFFFVLTGVNRNTSRFIESRMKSDTKAIAHACEIYPANWRVCFLKSMAEANSDHPETALPWLQKNLKNRPFDYHTLRALAFFYANNGDKEKSCQVAHVYNTVLKEAVIFNDFLDRECKDIPPPFKFENSWQFENAYKKWLGL